MGYKALYRTYRPQKFDEVAGQKQIIQTLKNAIKDNKIAHAYLFTGPRGTGKTTMAKLLAKALNCACDDVKPCNECSACKAINEGSFADVIEIDAASNNGVDEVRSLIDKVKYAPIEGKYKVYIIDEVHMMSQGAFNALLKTLEEPPAHVIFVLATTEPHKVLPTILSRCQRFDFGRISNNDIKERIERVLDSENVSYDAEVIDLVSELCDGGMRDALSILDQTIAYAGDNICAADVRSIYGIVSNEEKINFIKSVINNEHQKVMATINEYDSRGVDISRFTNNLIDLLKECVIYSGSNSFKGLKIINDTNCDSIKGITTSKAFKMIDVLVEALSSYRKAGAPKTLFEIACLKMSEINESSVEKVVYKEVVKEVLEKATPKAEVKQEIKEELSLKGSPLLVLGSHDQVCTSIGAGALNSGEAVDGLGTVECITAIFDKKCDEYAMGQMGYPCVPYAIEGLYCTYLLNYSCGSTVNWLKKNIMHGFCGEEDNYFTYIEKDLKKGPSGLLTLPYFGGAATPRQDLSVKGGIINLTTQTTDADIYKSIMEGTAMEMKYNAEVLKDFDIDIKELVATGGGANDKMWMQIKADIQEVSIKTLRSSEGGLCGTAMISAVALGGAKNYEQAKEIFVRYNDQFTPQQDMIKAYKTEYAKYKKLYNCIKEVNTL